MKIFWFRSGLAVVTFLVGVSLNAVWQVEDHLQPAVQNKSAANVASQKDAFAGWFYDLRADEIPKRNRAVKAGVEFGDESAEQQKLIVGAMTGEISRICSARYLSAADFDEIQILSIILADWQVVEALDVLIDCSSQSRYIINDLPGADDFPLYAGIVRYGQSATPTLRKRLKDVATREEIKQLIVNALREIDRQRVEYHTAKPNQRLMKIPAPGLALKNKDF